VKHLAVRKRYRLPIDVLENGTADADDVGHNGKVVDQWRIDLGDQGWSRRAWLFRG